MSTEDGYKKSVQQTDNFENFFIPYGRPVIDEEDIQAVIEVLRSGWITTGPKVVEFEKAVADFVGAKEAVAVSNGTAALHTAIHAAGIGPGDEVILPPITFVATANAVLYCGGTPVFADVDPGTLLIDPAKVAEKITSNTKAIVAVDYAGQPCDYDALKDIARRRDLLVVADACHALGAEYKDEKVGTLADLTVFSFHPVKHITTGEGGMVVADNPKLAEKMRRFRNHGIAADYHQRAEHGTWFYEMVELGHNYRITDFQCALGISQLKKLPQWIEKRREIVDSYASRFKNMPGIRPLDISSDVFHSFHLYVVRLDLDRLSVSRRKIFFELRNNGIGVNVHYIPVHLHPFYMERLGSRKGDCPVAEAAYEQIFTLPLYPSMSDDDIAYVVDRLANAMES